MRDEDRGVEDCLHARTERLQLIRRIGNT
jgi:hypothetical protein